MGDLTQNISRHELACRCLCGFDSMDWETINVVQDACDHFARILMIDHVICTITSAARCFEYNRKPTAEGGPGSNDRSQHPLARAIDFKVVGVSPVQIYSFLNTKYADRYGIGLYATFVHIDTRSDGPARW